MLLTTIILSIVAILAIISLFTTGVLGSILLAVFGDALVFILLIVLIVKLIRKYSKKK